MNIAVLIIVVVCVVILGIVSVLIDIHKRKGHQRQICDYIEKVASLAEKLVKKEDITQEAIYIIAHSPAISKYLKGDTSPTLILSSRLANKVTYGSEQYINEIGRDVIQTQQQLEDEKHDLLRLLWNPFTLFYRGIGLILRIVFGYFIELFNKDFDFDGKAWKTLTVIISLFASIFTIMTFFGFDWAKIMSFQIK